MRIVRPCYELQCNDTIHVGQTKFPRNPADTRIRARSHAHAHTRDTHEIPMAADVFYPQYTIIYRWLKSPINRIRTRIKYKCAHALTHAQTGRTYAHLYNAANDLQVPTLIMQMFVGRLKFNVLTQYRRRSPRRTCRLVVGRYTGCAKPNMRLENTVLVIFGFTVFQMIYPSISSARKN